MGPTVITRSQILTIRTDASPGGRWPDQSMVDACNTALWEVDGNGELRGCYLARAQRVRDAITARTLAGEMYPHA